MLRSKTFKAGFIAAFIVITALAIMGQGQGPFFTNPIFRGNTSGNRFLMTWKIADVTADTWVLGDTTAAGTPNSVTIAIEGKYRQGDYLE